MPVARQSREVACPAGQVKSLRSDHVVADCVSFATTFYASQQKSSLTRSVAPPLQIEAALLGFDLVFTVDEIRFHTWFAKKKGLEPRAEMNGAPVEGRKKTPPENRGSLPLMPCRPNDNLHDRAGGLPKFCFAASNVRPEAGRPAIRRFKSASLISDVGLLGREGRERRHAHSRNPVLLLSGHATAYACGAPLIPRPRRRRAGP